MTQNTIRPQMFEHAKKSGLERCQVAIKFDPRGDS